MCAPRTSHGAPPHRVCLIPAATITASRRPAGRRLAVIVAAGIRHTRCGGAPCEVRGAHIAPRTSHVRTSSGFFHVLACVVQEPDHVMVVEAVVREAPRTPRANEARAAKEPQLVRDSRF